ncbi:helix-turn-helix domain-containing protein [Kitasatospora arboriphila]|uniref:HTH tetR-type domain-containing protein n=1 Tax=Kitasatospora arboriphila TaxID=258052 RepID=A0ABN1U3U3_9ACTN
MSSPAARGRRPAAETRAEILGVALDLFTEKGYEATSVRDISEALGVTKSALYYHFRNKEEIVASLVAERREEVRELAAWISAQPRTPGLVREAALRWIAGTTPERLAMMRLAQANQPVMRRLSEDAADVPGAFEEVVGLLVGEHADEQQRLAVRMAFDTVRAALLAAQGTAATDRDVLEAARRATVALTRAEEGDTADR